MPVVDYLAEVAVDEFLRDYLPGNDLPPAKILATRNDLEASLKDVKKESDYYTPLVSPLSTAA